MTRTAVSIRDLEKIYAEGKHALKGVSLDIPTGSMFGLLGPNGAGKSTLINILSGLVNKTGGSASIWGFDIDKNPRNAKLSIGVVPQELMIDVFFTPLESLEIQRGLYGLKADREMCMEILRALRLDDKYDAYARTLSGGMKRRLLVAKALVHNPPILVLDEPTAGVDVELRQQLWAYVRALHQSGVTVILTTHYLEEAEELCDQIAIINNGEVIANARTDKLVAMAQTKRIIVTLDRDVVEIPQGLADYNPHLVAPRILEMNYNRHDNGIAPCLHALAEAGLGIADLSTAEDRLEDVFLRLTQAS